MKRNLTLSLTVAVMVLAQIVKRVGRDAHRSFAAIEIEASHAEPNVMRRFCFGDGLRGFLPDNPKSEALST
jgi:hypothetical protein